MAKGTSSARRDDAAMSERNDTRSFTDARRRGSQVKIADSIAAPDRRESDVRAMASDARMERVFMEGGGSPIAPGERLGGSGSGVKPPKRVARLAHGAIDQGRESRARLRIVLCTSPFASFSH